MKREKPQLSRKEEQAKREKAQLIKTVIIVAVNALCLIAFFVCLLVSSSMRESLRSQQAASAWSGQSGERFAQLSAFFPDSFGFDEESVHNVRSSIDISLLSASLESTPGRTLYTDAWSAITDITIVSDRNPSPVSAKAIAVGGDFFTFHPLFLRDGSYLSPDDVMKDRVVLDEELAWRLFGATRLAGFEVIIDEKPFIIAGVISRDNDFASTRADQNEFSLFMSFDALMALTEGDAEITSYEIVMPDPISGFALNALTDAISDENVHIVENSDRFSLTNLFTHIGAFGRHSIRTSGISLPYWENAARIVEDWLALLLALSIVFIIFPIICAIIYTVKLIRFGIGRGKDTVKGIIDEKDRRDYEEYLLKHGDEPQIYDNEDNTGYSDYNEEGIDYGGYDDDHIINYDIYDESDNVDNNDTHYENNDTHYDITEHNIDDILSDAANNAYTNGDDNADDTTDKSLYIDILYNTSNYDTDIDEDSDIVDSIKNDVNNIIDLGSGSTTDDVTENSSEE